MTGDQKRPNPVDVHVGSRVRLRRTLLGLSQEKVAEGLGLTFQQQQKYERGTNRIGASRLFDLACILEVPVGYFFEDMTEAVTAQSPRALKGRTPRGTYEPDPLAAREDGDVEAFLTAHDPRFG